MGYRGKKYTREQAHDKLYSLACRLLDRMDACSKCPIFVRDTQRDSCGFSKAWCCEGCPNLGPTGCTAEALLCRLHLCADENGRQRRLNPVLQSRMKRIRAIAREYNILIARATKAEALEYGETKDPWYMYRKHKMKFTGENV